MNNDLTMSDLDRLLAEQACRDLVVRTVTLTDAQDYEAFARLFIEDGLLARPGAEPLQGHAAIIESYRSRPADRLTRHLISNTCVDLESSTFARATSSLLLWVGSRSDPEGPFGRQAQARQVVGDFDDRFVKTADGWRIAQRDARFVLFRE